MLKLRGTKFFRWDSYVCFMAGLKQLFVTETEFAFIGVTWAFLSPTDRLRLLISSASIRRALLRIFLDLAVHLGLRQH